MAKKERRAVGNLVDILDLHDKELAEVVGMSYKLIRGWLTGKKKINPEHALILSNAWGVSQECLIANEVGPCLMQDGRVATMELIDEWKNRRPDTNSAAVLANRAGLMVKELVLIASKENRLAYREALQAVSLLVMKYGKAKALAVETRPVVSCRINEISYKYDAIWKLIEDDSKIRALISSVPRTTKISMAWTTSEMMHPLSIDATHSEMPGRSFNEVERLVKHNVVVKSGEKTIEVERFHWYFTLPLDSFDEFKNSEAK